MGKPRPGRRPRDYKRKMVLRTKNPGHECDLDWTFDNILKFAKEEFVEKVVVDRSCRSNFKLVVRVEEDEDLKYSIVWVGFKRCDKKKGDIRLFYDLSIKNLKGDVYKREVSNLVFSTAGRPVRCLSLKFADMNNLSGLNVLRVQDLTENNDILETLVLKNLIVWDDDKTHMLYVLPDETLVVKGWIKLFGCCHFSHSLASDLNLDAVVEESEVMRDFKKAFEEKLYTDVSLKTRDDMVQAHRFVLSSRCPKFRRILERKEKDGENMIIQVNDMDKIVLEIFLRYLYTGIVGEVRWGTLLELYSVADNYVVTSLKQHCGRVMASRLSERKVCEVLKLADFHDDGYLKDKVIEYLAINFQKIDQNEWDSLTQENSRLAAEVWRLISTKVH